jgi:hypothetical protein
MTWSSNKRGREASPSKDQQSQNKNKKPKSAPTFESKKFAAPLQSASYAVERLRSDSGMTHTINLDVIGATFLSFTSGNSSSLYLYR